MSKPCGNHKAKICTRFAKDKEGNRHEKSPIHKGRQQERIKGARKMQNSQKTVSEKASVDFYISVVTPNVNGLRSSFKNTEWLNELKTRPIYILPIRDSLQL